MIGVAFSIGFLLGPLIGAAFSLQTKGHEGQFYVAPALYALTLAILDVIFLAVFLKETLPREKRVRNCTGRAKSFLLALPVLCWYLSLLVSTGSLLISVLVSVYASVCLCLS